MKKFCRYVLPHIPFIGLVCVVLNEKYGINLYKRPFTYFSSIITQVIGMLLIFIIFKF